MSRDRIAGMILVIGILLSAGMALAGYRMGHDAVMVYGSIGMIVLAVWAFVTPGTTSGDAGYTGSGASGCDGPGDGGDCGGGGE